jgi:hypothetical protein
MVYLNGVFKTDTVGRLLKERDHSLQANAKTKEAGSGEKEVCMKRCNVL